MPDLPPSHKAPAYKAVVSHEAKRERTASRGYGGRWQRLRASFLGRKPLCSHCATRKIVKAATDVDHIVPHRGDQTLFWDQSNWQPLCRACHSAKTAKEDGGFGNTKR